MANCQFEARRAGQFADRISRLARCVHLFDKMPEAFRLLRSGLHDFAGLLQRAPVHADSTSGDYCGMRPFVSRFKGAGISRTLIFSSAAAPSSPAAFRASLGVPLPCSWSFNFQDGIGDRDRFFGREVFTAGILVSLGTSQFAK